jgi:hypothetical protein
MRRIAEYASSEYLPWSVCVGARRHLAGAFAAYMPKGYVWVNDVVQANVQYYKDVGYMLTRPFRNSVWPACTWNMPPKSCACDHRDAGNAPCIPCSITALGNFDPDRSGALILFDLRLVIRFPPGSTILICSGGMRHANTAIHPDDRRASFIQYCAGGLSRHIEYEFQAGDEVDEDVVEAVAARSEERWEESLALFSTRSSLDRDRKNFQTRSIERTIS